MGVPFVLAHAREVDEGGAVRRGDDCFDRTALGVRTLPASGLAQSIINMLYNYMVMITPDADLLDATFFALADPTRRAILARLATGEASVGELAEPFEMSQPAISKHLKVLERAGLVSVDQDGTRRLRRLETAPLHAATDWIARYRDLWESQFRRLDAVLDELKAARRSD
jgi:DNA-binding transcriptional ArsR family regulator